MSSAQIVSASAIHGKMRMPFGMTPLSGMGLSGMYGEHGVPQSSPSYLKQEMNPLMSPQAVRQIDCVSTISYINSLSVWLDVGTSRTWSTYAAFHDGIQST